jgi:hypothetical protein
MNQEISKRDWETLSAYLDGQLSAKKLARFESRLSQEPTLQTALDELYAARLVLRNTPRLRPPRNFFLTLEMVGKPRRLPNLAPVFGWVSVVASLLFVFVLIGGFINTGEVLPVAVIEMLKPVSFSADSVGLNPASQAAEESMALDVAAAGGLSEAVESEIMAGEVALDVAVAPEMETVPKGPDPEAPAAPEELPILAEESSPQTDMETAVEALPEETVSVASAQITNTTRSDQQEEFLAASAALLPTPTETFLIQEGGHHIEKTATQEVVVVETENMITTVLPSPQPSVENTPISVQPEPSVLETEPVDDREIAMNAVETTSESDWSAAIPQEQAQSLVAEDQTSNILMGVEVLLILFAFGTGIAWIYLHRRGG